MLIDARILGFLQDQRVTCWPLTFTMMVPGPVGMFCRLSRGLSMFPPIACPHCQAPLRIQDRSFLGRELPCPECTQPLRIVENLDQQLHVDSVTTPADNGFSTTQAAPAVTGQNPSTRKKLRSKPTTADSTGGKKTRSAKKKRPAKGKKPRSEANGTTASGTMAATSTGMPSAPLRFSFNPPGRQDQPAWTTRLWRRCQTAQGIAWLSAGGLFLVLLLILQPFSSGQPTAEPAPVDETSHPANTPTPATTPVVENNPVAPAVPVLPSPAAEFQRLGEELRRDLGIRDEFPRNLAPQNAMFPPDRQFSWIAEFAGRQPGSNGFPPRRDRAWDDPANDRFVRQRLPLFLNPLIAQKASADRYPATHFVGMAGVGHDAATLACDHPRAGIFGENRVTRPADVLDGLSHTMFIVGVQQDVGAWAAGGRATMRAFTQEPYINGPDGIGSGEPDGMTVLMADGSVRFVSRKTSPEIIRQLATIADGHSPQLPTVQERLNPSVAPGNPPPAIANLPPAPNEVAVAPLPPLPQPPDPAVPPTPDPSPPDPEPANSEPPMPMPEKPAIPSNDTDNANGENPPAVVDIAPPAKTNAEIEAALSIKVAAFEQSQPVPLFELLTTFEELAGVPLQFAIDDKQSEPIRPAEKRWQSPATLVERDATVGELLTSLLQSHKLTWKIADGAIVLSTKK